MILNGWKEIATYLGLGVRTVQRYECELGLPIRRPRRKKRSAVMAITMELDAWRRKPGIEIQVQRSATINPTILAYRSVLEEAERARQSHREAVNNFLKTISKIRDGATGRPRNAA